MSVIAAAQQTPRPWDGRRALRFLAGLAMLALAVTLHLPGPATVTAAPTRPSDGVVLIEGEIPHPASAPEPESPMPAVAAIEIVTAPRVLPAGEIPRSAGSRAPPAR
jgi:hypothetical protein